MIRTQTKKSIYLFLLWSVMAIGCHTPAHQNKENKITFDSLQVEQTYLPNEQQEAPVCSVSLHLTYPDKTADREVLKKMREQFVRAFLGENYENLPPEEAVEKFTADYIDMYKGLKNDYEKELGEAVPSTFSFSETISNRIEYNKNGLISYTVQADRYRGGAHGSSEQMHYVLNFKTGETVTEQDLFINDYQKELSEILIDHILKENQVEKPADLENLGYFSVEEIAPNNNFLIREEGIVYTFNEYEIAAYAVGIIQVYIPYDEIRHLLKKEGPLSYETVS